MIKSPSKYFDFYSYFVQHSHSTIVIFVDLIFVAYIFCFSIIVEKLVLSNSYLSRKMKEIELVVSERSWFGLLMAVAIFIIGFDYGTLGDERIVDDVVAQSDNSLNWSH